MVVFSVQAKLPSRQYVRLVGNLEKLGKWSPYDSLELQPSPGDCRYICNNKIDGFINVLVRFCANLILDDSTSRNSLVVASRC